MIREAVREDMDAICILSNEINTEHHASMPEIFSKPDGSNRDAPYWFGFIERDDGKAFVAEVNGKVIGVAGATIPQQPKPPFLKDKTRCTLSTIVVTQSYRRKGVGRQLINAVESYARSQGAEEVILDVMHFNQSAVGFYKSIGYGDFSTRLMKATALV